MINKHDMPTKYSFITLQKQNIFVS